MTRSSTPRCSAGSTRRSGVARGAVVVGLAGAAVVGLPSAALAHEAPEGNEFVLADWMLLSWLVTFLVGLTALVIALKRGMLSDLESAKYYLLTIDEPDYYTPDWAREEASDADPGGVPGGPER